MSESNTLLNVTPINVIQPTITTLTLTPLNVVPGGAADLNPDIVGSDEPVIVHLRIQKRTGKKCLTFIQGVPSTVDIKSLTQKLSKLYNCNCASIEHPKIGKCLQLSGDHRDDLKQFLVKERIVANVRDIKIHGF